MYSSLWKIVFIYILFLLQMRLLVEWNHSIENHVFLFLDLQWITLYMDPRLKKSKFLYPLVM